MTSVPTFPPEGRRSPQTPTDRAAATLDLHGSSPISRAPATLLAPKDHWEGLREADVKRNGLFELLKTADERLSPLLSALTPAAGSPPEPRPMPASPGIVPPLHQHVAEFLERRRRTGGSQGII